MGVMVLCGCLVKCVGVAVVAFVAASFFGGPGYQMQSKYFTPEPSPEFYGPFTINSTLESAERLLEHELSGPESMVIINDVIYTGVADGRIVRIKNNKIETVVRVGGKDCKPIKPKEDESKRCGRALGMRLDPLTGDIIVADMTKGVYRLSVSTGSITTIIPGSAVIDGKRLNFPNDLTVGAKGDIYFTDCTSWPVSRYGLDAGMLAVAEHSPGGRILHYNPQTKKVRTLVERLYVPNGIQLSKNEDFIFFSQFARYNILKYHLQGAKKGQLEILVDNLPGTPDNIRPSGRGTYWVALYMARLPGEPSLLERTLPSPMERRLAYGSFMFVIQVYEYLATFLPVPIMEIIPEAVRMGIWGTFGDKNYGLVFEMKEDGTILRSLHSPKGRLSGISQVNEHKDFLYFCTAFNDYIGKIRLYK